MNAKIIHDENPDPTQRYSLLNYQIIDMLFFALFQNKKVHIAYDEKNSIDKQLIHDLLLIINKVGYDSKLLNFVGLSTRMINHFNIFLDQLRIYRYCLNHI
ncbi:hypothetical protein IKS57_03460 [bacterium]|nr:hypothetical protein [bacterium]